MRRAWRSTGSKRGLVDELRWLSEAPAPGPTGAAVAPGPTAWRGPWILAGILAGAAVVGLLLTLAPWAPWRAVPAPRSTELTFTPFSFEQGGQRGAVWSPDGTAVAFAARQADTDPGADGYVAAHLNRRLSVPISARLARTRITPTQITVISFLIALVGAACFAVGRHWTAVIGALLVQLSSVVDGCDGELARLRHLATARGGVARHHARSLRRCRGGGRHHGRLRGRAPRRPAVARGDGRDHRLPVGELHDEGVRPQPRSAVSQRLAQPTWVRGGAAEL